uniref:Bicarbonate transporter-like transmembrane domain-containing protein n=1 Tax=Panagrolaimus sp. ES5 TaxID=591445 RepID=A0AC34FDJ3_9BILA
MDIEHKWVIGIAFFPAAFYTILIVMDQQITAVIVNRKDNKLKKGYGYHLDLFIITILVLICSILGLPFYVAATVLSVMHVDSLKVESECAAPGEKPQFLGVKEQRLTAILSHVIILCSVFLTSLIKLVPLPVLTGIFLYMGVVSLLGQQFVQRIALLFMPIKHQPDYTWLRTVKMKRVHLFTIIQIASIVALFAVKFTKSISMVFPLMLVLMVIIRMYLLEKIFTPQELVALDDKVCGFTEIMTPPTKRRPKVILNSATDEESAAFRPRAKSRNGSVPFTP